MNSEVGGVKAVVFDLDGTLVSSENDIVNSFLHAFHELNLRPPARGEVRARIGAPLEEMYAAFAPAELVPRLSANYREHYSKNFAATTRPFPGVPELLRELGARGYRRVVATTKRTAMAAALVSELGLRHDLDHVQGTDGFPAKPSPEVIHRALRAVNGVGVVMVGDTPLDMGAGAAAGLPTYGVTWGTSDEAALTSAGAHVVADNLGRLMSLICELEAGSNSRCSG